jgi:hypothetical protein
MYVAMVHIYSTPKKTVRAKKSMWLVCSKAATPEAGKLGTAVVQHRIFRGPLDRSLCCDPSASRPCGGFIVSAPIGSLQPP